MSNYYFKYLKYKLKYNKLLSSIGGGPDDSQPEIDKTSPDLRLLSRLNEPQTNPEIPQPSRKFEKLLLRPYKLINELAPLDTLSMKTSNISSLKQEIYSYKPMISEIEMNKIMEMIDNEDRTKFFDNFKTCKIVDHHKCKIYFIEKHIKLLVKKLDFIDFDIKTLKELREIIFPQISRYGFSLTTFIINP